MTPQEPMGALLRHLEQAPCTPIPEALRGPLLATLRRSRAERDRLLGLAAAELDPLDELGRWGRAQALAKAVQRFTRPENGARTGRRPPRDRVEELLVQADRCGAGLPTSSRRCWDALRPVDEGLSRGPEVG